MRRRSTAFPPRPQLPPLLGRVIDALKQASRDPISREGEAAALAALAEWALVAVPARGVFAPADPDAYTHIQTIARAHLVYAEASREFRAALKRVDDASIVDALESTQNRLNAISDIAYYYAGFACGVTLAHLTSGVSHE